MTCTRVLQLDASSFSQFEKKGEKTIHLFHLWNRSILLHLCKKKKKGNSV